jgi:outer membrane protein assembly factor BamB
MMSILSENSDEWPMYQHDPQHSGQSPFQIPDSLQREWVNRSSTAFETGLSHLAVSGNKVIVTRGESLSALDSTTGSVLWELVPIPMYESHPAISNEKIYINTNGRFICVDSISGKIFWEHRVGNLSFYSYPIVVDNYVIVGGGLPISDTIPILPEDVDDSVREEILNTLITARKNGHKMKCFDAETGAVIWEYYLYDYVTASPAYFEGNVYINDDRRVHCVSLETGNLNWMKELEEDTNFSLTLDEERIYIKTRYGITCLDIHRGTLLWKYACEDVIETPSVKENTIFFPTFSGKIICLNASDGSLLWEKEYDSRITSGIVIGNKDKIAFGTYEGILNIVDARSGEIIDTHVVDHSILSLALAEKHLFVSDSRGNVYCLTGSGPEKNDTEKLNEGNISTDSNNNLLDNLLVQFLFISFIFLIMILFFLKIKNIS